MEKTANIGLCMKDEAESAVREILNDYKGGRAIDKVSSTQAPNRDVVIRVLHELFQVIYPGYYRDPNNKGRVYNIDAQISTVVDDIIINLEEQIEIALRYTNEFTGKARHEVRAESQKIAISFIRTIPKIREYLDTDCQAILDGDPAAYSKSEIILSYPGMYAITVYRCAHELYRLHVPMIPRIMSEHAHSKTGVDIHPGATIGKYFMIDHATGVVVGETTIMGEHVKIYQGVLIGVLFPPMGPRFGGVRVVLLLRRISPSFMGRLSPGGRVSSPLMYDDRRQLLHHFFGSALYEGECEKPGDGAREGRREAEDSQQG